jgi:hypothetical protein
MMRSRSLMLVLAASLSVIGIGSTIAWSNSAASDASRGPAGLADQAIIEASSETRPTEARSFLTGVNVNEAYGDLLAKWARDDKASTRADFNQAFADATGSSRDNTPTNREKLRNAGWARIIAR